MVQFEDPFESVRISLQKFGKIEIVMKNQNDPKEDWQHIVSEFHNKTDRATAVLGAAFLEAHLGQLIASFLIDESGAANHCSILGVR